METNTQDAVIEQTAKKTAHDDFDWTIDKRNVTSYSKDKYATLDTMYSNSITTIEENEIVTGTIVGITSTDVVLSVGFKSDGLVPTSEFRDIEDLAIGQKYEVYVMSKEDKKGHLILSRKNAKLKRAWEQIVEANEKDIIVTGLITSKTKGGLIANVFGLHRNSVANAKNIVEEDKKCFSNLALPLRQMNKLKNKAPLLQQYLLTIETKSGILICLLLFIIYYFIIFNLYFFLDNPFN